MAAANPNASTARPPGSPPAKTIALDAQFHDTNELTQVVECFVCNVAGNVKFVSVGSTTAVTMTCLAGLVYWFAIKQIFSTGTTATGLTGGY